MHTDPDRQELEDMIADYMEKGFLENIVDMLKYDRSLYPVAAKMLKDERIRVRIGAVALVESVAELALEDLGCMADCFLPLLENENAFVRGDAAYCLGIIGTPSHLPGLMLISRDENQEVQEAALEAIEDIKRRG